MNVLMKWLRRWFLPRAEERAETPPPDALVGAVPLAPVPGFIKAIAFPQMGGETAHHEHLRETYDQGRDPGRALASLRQCAAGAGARRSAGTWAAADAEKSVAGGIGVFPQLDCRAFTEGTAFLEHRNGAEHDAFFDPATGRVIKLTQPGEYGASEGLVEYLQRMAWANELFEDDILVEGWLRYPNEPAPRLVTSQP